MDPLSRFHPAVRAWFQGRFESPTDAQRHGWPAILRGRDTLIAAPTGSGKTLAAFLAGIDRLWRAAEAGELDDGIQIVYVSPLRALSNDVHRNLEVPLAEIAETARRLGLPQAEIRVSARTGDTSAAARREMARHPPHILITTPESLYLMLTAESSRSILRTARTVIVDEIHALIRDKRGSHLALSLARLDHLCGRHLARIGLSATQRPIEASARFLVGADRTDADATPDCAIVDLGHQRHLDLGIEVAPAELQAVASGEDWADIYSRLAELIAEHRTTLVFVNTRRQAERVAHQLAQRLGEDQVGSHHGSLARDRRLDLERRLKAGELRALVATASLELGIDIGSVDLVCQVESPRSVTTFLQRVGRSGHALGRVPSGRLFPTTRDEGVECAALVRAVRDGRLDSVQPPVAPLDILAQQIVAECASQPWAEDGLFDLVRRATPYATLGRADFDSVVEMLSDGYGTGGGRVRGYLHRDRIAGMLRARRGARMAAIECGGAIPDVADYRVIAEPSGTVIGTVDEDFAVESMAGDIILLGTSSWRIRKIEVGTVRVEDAAGAPPNVPFWLGEAPSRTPELSDEVARLRGEIAEHIDAGDAERWLAAESGLEEAAARQVVQYVRAGRDSLGVVPNNFDIVFERFFDEAGGMQLVVHAPLGGRINRAWGLALRKRFCRTFDFELQAAAGDDGILLSLGPQHSFPLEDVFRFLSPETVTEVLTQALLTSPMFNSRWRWNSGRALAVLRRRAGKRVAPQIQRMRSDDLLAAVFPQQVACQENVVGPIDLPDHPLVRQTVHDCLHEAMDLDGLRTLLGRIEAGEVRLHARDTTEPSPFAHEIVNSKPYTYLDNAPLEERRARAVALRRTLPENARDLGALDPEAIARVREEAWPQPRDAEELHDVLLSLVALRPGDGAGWEAWFDELRAAGRAGTATTAEGEPLWFAAENVHLLQSAYPGSRIELAHRLPRGVALPRPEAEDAGTAVARGHVECIGPTTVESLALRTATAPPAAAAALARLESQGVVLRGRFTPGVDQEEFCDRRLLARIHRYTLDRLRREIEPVSVQDFLRFLLRWQHVAPGTRLEGSRGLLEALAQLQGFEAPAAAWERHILPARVAEYRQSWLDELCLAGDVVWGRLSLGRSPTVQQTAASAATPITFALRQDLPWLLHGVRAEATPAEPAGGAGEELLALLRQRGALFYNDLSAATRRLPTDLERGLRDLVARGLVTADGFHALRPLLSGDRLRRSPRRRSGWPGSRQRETGGPAGRWSVLGHPEDAGEPLTTLAERWAEQLLRRYGIVFRSLIAREEVGLPWRELLWALRRLEARGLIRGGRFVEGFYGEQYALPEAVDALRAVRRHPASAGETVWLSSADPLNLVGIVTPGPRLPATLAGGILYQGGAAQAALDPARAGRWRAHPSPAVAGTH